MGRKSRAMTPARSPTFAHLKPMSSRARGLVPFRLSGLSRNDLEIEPVGASDDRQRHVRADLIFGQKLVYFVDRVHRLAAIGDDDVPRLKAGLLGRAARLDRDDRDALGF